MTIEHGLVYSLKRELWLGTHDLSSDTLKMALYQGSANLTLAGITAYTATGESSGSGYTAGGLVLPMAAGYPKLNETAQGGIAEGQMLLIQFNGITFTASITARAALIYNSSKSNKAIAILDFGQEITVASSLTLSWPTPDVFNAIIRAN